MSKLITWLTLVAALSTTQHASAASLSYIATLHGKCTHLLFGGTDGTHACIPMVANDVHADSRIGFTFTIGDLAVVTFSGMGKQQVKDSADVATQPLDIVIFTLVGVGTPPNRLKAAGVCTYSNPYAGPAKIRCTAHTSMGLFEGAFVSDGHAPAMQSF